MCLTSCQLFLGGSKLLTRIFASFCDISAHLESFLNQNSICLNSDSEDDDLSESDSEDDDPSESDAGVSLEKFTFFLFFNSIQCCLK